MSDREEKGVDGLVGNGYFCDGGFYTSSNVFLDKKRLSFFVS